MKKILGLIYSVIFVLAVTFLLIVYSPREVKNSKVSFISNGNAKEINAEIADNPLERTIGLMNRTGLAESAGMLFIFEGEAMRSFWMKDTLIPLDMIFVSEDLEIVHIQKNARPCESNPCMHYSSVYPAKYVVEVNGGFADRNNIQIGDKVEIN